jgi:hypothetical protein
MAQKRMIKRKPSSEWDRRITNMESKLQGIQDDIESKFKLLETFMNQTNNNANNFERLYTDLEEIKKNTKSKGISLFSRKKQGKKEVVNSENESSGLDLSQIGDLLQNPLIQSLFSNNNKNRRNDKRRKKSDGSSGLDISQIENLLQNPTIQSLLKRL